MATLRAGRRLPSSSRLAWPGAPNNQQGLNSKTRPALQCAGTRITRGPAARARGTRNTKLQIYGRSPCLKLSSSNSLSSFHRFHIVLSGKPARSVFGSSSRSPLLRTVLSAPCRARHIPSSQAETTDRHSRICQTLARRSPWQLQVVSVACFAVLTGSMHITPVPGAWSIESAVKMHAPHAYITSMYKKPIQIVNKTVDRSFTCF